MSVETETNQDQKILTIFIQGAFCFNLVKEFREAYQDYLGWQVIVDMRMVDYVDSSGLGMLLNMQSFLDIKDKDIRIINTKPPVRKILLISRFDKKFTIE